MADMQELKRMQTINKKKRESIQINLGATSLSNHSIEIPNQSHAKKRGSILFGL